MAKISTPGLTPKMFRHFAVVTIAATLLLAVFSSGENREAIAAQVAAQKEAEMARIKRSKPAYGEAKLKQEARPGKFESFGDGGGSFGQPMDQFGSQVQNVGGLDLEETPTAARIGGQYTPASYAQFGLSEKELAALSPAERAKLLARLRAGGLPSDPAERQKMIDALIAASAARSGESVTIE